MHLFAQLVGATIPVAELHIYPHQLTGFNELVGVPESVYERLLDSGQDVPIARASIRRVASIESMCVSKRFGYPAQTIVGGRSAVPSWEIVTANVLVRVDRMVFNQFGDLVPIQVMRIMWAHSVTAQYPSQPHPIEIRSLD